MTDLSEIMIDVRGLTVDFNAGKPVRAVSGVDFALKKGEVLALLGESGSGKSVSLRALMRLLPGHARIGGKVNVAGEDVLALNARKLSAFRGKEVAMIFQDPGLAFDPVYRIGDQIIEAIRRHEPVSRDEAYQRALKLFERVRIPSPERRLAAYPHEMSGGMRQRAMIALALACRPKVLLADEPTTALDATVQIQVLLLLRELQKALGLAVIFVTHDIGVAVEVADNVAIMYAGRIVETGTMRQVLSSPAHPYTQGLLASRNHETDAEGHLRAIPGSPPDLAKMPPGCAFAPRCAKVQPSCIQAVPDLIAIGDGHLSACPVEAAAHVPALV
jgi:peptide/nickel transport system ATP-binding protein